MSLPLAHCPPSAWQPLPSGNVDCYSIAAIDDGFFPQFVQSRKLQIDSHVFGWVFARSWRGSPSKSNRNSFFRIHSRITKVSHNIWLELSRPLRVVVFLRGKPSGSRGKPDVEQFAMQISSPQTLWVDADGPMNLGPRHLPESPSEEACGGLLECLSLSL